MKTKKRFTKKIDIYAVQEGKKKTSKDSYLLSVAEGSSRNEFKGRVDYRRTLTSTSG